MNWREIGSFLLLRSWAITALFQRELILIFIDLIKKEEAIGVLSFERGVEDFTLTCDSAVTSVFYHLYRQDPLLERIISQVPAGEFGVRKDKDNQLYLLGQALRVYQCELEEEVSNNNL